MKPKPIPARALSAKQPKPPEPEIRWSPKEVLPNHFFTEEWLAQQAYKNGIDEPHMFAVIPLTHKPTAARLKAIQRLIEMDEKELVLFVAAQLFHPLADYYRAKYPENIKAEQAKAVLTALGFLPSSAGRGWKGKK